MAKRDSGPEMLFRPQRETLAEAMAELREFDGSFAALRAILAPDEELVSVQPYCFDARIGWDTHIVMSRIVGSSDQRLSPAGFTNGPVLVEADAEAR